MSEQVKPQLVWLPDGLGGGEHVHVYRASDYDTLHAEAEALRDQNRDLRIEADGWFSRVNGVEAELEALRAENAKLRTALAEQGERQEPFVWMRPDGDESFELTSEGDYLSFPLYKAPQPSPDVRRLVEALEECAASLAWNCFGECRAIHAGPIMPAAMALDTARAALSTHRQAQPQ